MSPPASWWTEKLAEALQGETSARFLATLDAEDRPHFVPALSAQRNEEGLIRFAAMLPRDTLANLQNNSCCALLIVDQSFRWWTLRTTFTGFVEGEPGAKIKRWGWLRPEGVLAAGKYKRLRLASEYGWTNRLGIPKGDDYAATLPQEISRQINTLKAVKGIAFADEEGDVTALPCLSLVPAGAGALVCGTKTVPALQTIDEGADVAVCVLTFAPNAFHLCGEWEGLGGGFLRSNATIRVTGIRSALA